MTSDLVDDVVGAAVRAERERCAKIAEQYSADAEDDKMSSTAESIWKQVAGVDIAVRIRGR